MSHARENLSIYSIIFARWQHASRSWSWGAFGTPFWGRGGSTGSVTVSFERAMVVSYRLFIVTMALSLTIWPLFAIECVRRSMQQAVGHFGAEFVKEGDDRCKPNFKTIWERHGAVVCKRKEIESISSIAAAWAQCKNVTDRQTDH